MSSQANVYTSVSSQAWYTDKAMISTGNTAVTYNVALYPDFGNTIYSAPVSVPPYTYEYIYVGVGNQLTITGANFTAAEAGTASSALAGVNGVGSY
jgi:hypothetical protein